MKLVSIPRLALLTAAGLLPWSVSAHPGHGLGERGALHVVTSPFHVATLLCLGAAFWVAGGLATRSSVRRRLATLGTMSVGAAGVVWGLGM